MERINVETSDQPCLNDKTPRRFNRGEKKRKKISRHFLGGNMGPWKISGTFEQLERRGYCILEWNYYLI